MQKSSLNLNHKIYFSSSKNQVCNLVFLTERWLWEPIGGDQLLQEMSMLRKEKGPFQLQRQGSRGQRSVVTGKLFLSSSLFRLREGMLKCPFGVSCQLSDKKKKITRILPLNSVGESNLLKETCSSNSSVSCFSMSDSLQPWWTKPTRLLCQNSPGKNFGVGCHSPLQSFLDQGIEPGLLHCRQNLCI